MSTCSNWKNVNNWHWVEKDYSSVAKEFVSSIETSDNFASIETASFEGEFLANVRKGKIILIYDYKLEITFKNAVLEKLTFAVEVDSADEDSYKRDLTDQERVHVLPVLCSLIQALNSFVANKARAELIGESQKNELQNVENKNRNEDVQSSNIIKTPVSSLVCFTSQWSFSCPFEVLRECLVGNLYPIWSRSEKEGEIFNVYGGLISYKIKSEKENCLELYWKLKPWSDYSLVKIISEIECGKTILRLYQNLVEPEFVATAEENWIKYFWNPISVSTGTGFEKHD